MAVLLSLLLQSQGACFAQSQSWTTQARAQSQVACSAGLTALTKGQTDVAIASLVRATQSDVSDPLPYALLGLALNIKGRYDEALDALHRAYKMTPKDDEIILSIGLTHYLRHDYDKALNAWRR